MNRNTSDQTFVYYRYSLEIYLDKSLEPLQHSSPHKAGLWQSLGNRSFKWGLNGHIPETSFTFWVGFTIKNANYVNMITCPSSVSSLFGKVVRREKAVPEYCGLYNIDQINCLIPGVQKFRKAVLKMQTRDTYDHYKPGIYNIGPEICYSVRVVQLYH